MVKSESFADIRPIDIRAVALLVLLSLVLAAACMQVPFNYTFIAGKERGPQSDLPFVQGFKAAEASDTIGRWRWSDAQASIVVPAIGQRSSIVGMNIISHRVQWEPYAPPTVLYLTLGQADTISLTLRPAGARYQFYVPAQTMVDGGLHLGLATQSWQNPLDRRGNMGVAIGEQVTIQSIAPQGLVLPSLLLLLCWAVCLFVLWWMLLMLGFSAHLAYWLLLPLAVIFPLLLTLEAPRLGFDPFWYIQLGVISVAAAGLCVQMVPPLLRRLNLLPPSVLLRWLLLLMVLSFALKYSSRLYPESMPGDLQLHVNRYIATVEGEIYIRAQHRGLPFPFPNGLYLLVAPFTLSGLEPHFLFELFDGMFEATTVLLLYLLVAQVSSNMRLGVLAAAIYALTAGGHMVTWFAFATQVGAQWFTVLLVTVLVFCWPRRRDWVTWWIVVMLLAQVFLGHIGQFINLSLVGVLLIVLLWWRSRAQEERAGTLWLLSAGVAAGAFVALFYYTAFWDLILEQVTGVASQGMNEVTGRDPIPRAVTLRVLWEGGLIDHFGFFPVLLAIVPGLGLLASHRLRGSILPPLVWLSFLVSMSQAVLPLITLNSITTRWLMFSAWAIAVAGAWGVPGLWRRGQSGRLVVLLMAGYVCWVTLVVWADAMILRLPPIEPF